MVFRRRSGNSTTTISWMWYTDRRIVYGWLHQCSFSSNRRILVINMATIKKFLKIVDPHRGYYTHEDQEQDGLRFRTITHGANHVTLLIVGEPDKVDAYITREKAIVIPDEDMKAQYDADVPVKTRTCPTCGTPNAIHIPEFDLTATKKILDDTHAI